MGKRTIDDTINNLFVTVGGSIIAGDIVAFLLGNAQNSLASISWYFWIGMIGLLLVIIGESRIYNGILFKKE